MPRSAPPRKQLFSNSAAQMFSVPSNPGLKDLVLTYMQSSGSLNVKFDFEDNLSLKAKKQFDRARALLVRLLSKIQQGDHSPRTIAAAGSKLKVFERLKQKHLGNASFNSSELTASMNQMSCS